MPSSDSDALAAALDAAAARIARAVRAAASVAPVLLIDGRSGAGKTTLARLVVARLQPAPQLVAMDSVYPGWDGLAAGVAQVRDGVLRPHVAGHAGVWTAWDWAADRPGASHETDPDRALIVEGCGILTPETAQCADVTVWVQAPDAARKLRALARDGDGYRPHWDRWAAQEDEHIRRHNPRERASITVALP